MIQSFLCYAVVILSNINAATAEIKTSDGSWTHQSKLSTAAARSNLVPSLGSASISANNATYSNSTSICSTASIYGTLTVQELCPHTSGTEGSSEYTRSTQNISNTTLPGQAAVAAGVTNFLGEITAVTRAESSAAALGISAAAQTSPSATTLVLNAALTPLPSTQSRPSLLHLASGTSLSRDTGSTEAASISEGSSIGTISIGSNSPIATSSNGLLDLINGTLMTNELSSSLTMPTTATSSSSITTMGNANATLSNASLAMETNELQKQLLAAVTLTQTWINKSTESNSNNAINAINGTIFFAQALLVKLPNPPGIDSSCTGRTNIFSDLLSALSLSCVIQKLRELKANITGKIKNIDDIDNIVTYLTQPKPSAGSPEPSPNTNPEPSPKENHETNNEPSTGPTQTQDDSKSSSQARTSSSSTTSPSITSTKLSSTRISSSSSSTPDPSITSTKFSFTKRFSSSSSTPSPSITSTKLSSTKRSSASCATTVTTSACGVLCVPTGWEASNSALQSCSTSCFSTVLSCDETATISTSTKPASCPLATFTTVGTPIWLGATWSAEKSFLEEITSTSVNAYSTSSFASSSSPSSNTLGEGNSGSDEGGSASGEGAGSYGVAVIPAPGANLVVPPLTSCSLVSYNYTVQAAPTVVTACTCGNVDAGLTTKAINNTIYTMCAGSPWPTMTSSIITSSSTIISIAESYSPTEPVLQATTSFDPPKPSIMSAPPTATSFDPSIPTLSCGAWISPTKKAVPEAVPPDQIDLVLDSTRDFCTPQLEGKPRGNVAIPNQKANPIFIEFPFKGTHDGEIEMYMAWDPREECKYADTPVIEAPSPKIPDMLCLQALNNVANECGIYGGVTYIKCRMYGWFSFDASTWEKGSIGERSLHESVKAPEMPSKSLESRGDVIDERFHFDESSHMEKITQLPSTYLPGRLDRRVDIVTLWNTLEGKGRTRYGAVLAELWRRPRRNKGCIDPNIWELQKTPSVDPGPELQVIMARINFYYAQGTGPQIPLALGSWDYYSADFPKIVRPTQFHSSGLMSTQARSIVGVLGKAIVRASDPSLVIPPGSTDLLHAPNHAADIAFAIWKAKCTDEGGLSPSILQWVIMQDVVESISVQVLEYMFGSIGFYAVNGQPNLAFLNKDTAAFYVLLNTPILVGMSYMLENYALDLGGYILGVGITWQPTPRDSLLHPTGRKYYMWLQIFHM